MTNDLMTNNMVNMGVLNLSFRPQLSDIQFPTRYKNYCSIPNLHVYSYAHLHINLAYLLNNH